MKSAENLAIVRPMALNVLKQDKSTQASIKRKKLLAAFDDKFRTKLIRQAF